MHIALSQPNQHRLSASARTLPITGTGCGEPQGCFQIHFFPSLWEPSALTLSREFRAHAQQQVVREVPRRHSIQAVQVPTVIAPDWLIDTRIFSPESDEFACAERDVIDDPILTSVCRCIEMLQVAPKVSGLDIVREIANEKRNGGKSL